MKRYIVIYRAPNDAQMETANMSAEQQAEGMKAWMGWAQKCGDKLIDLGSPLANGKSIHYNGSISIVEGVSGYSILQAENMEEANALLQGHPHLGWNAACSIEVHETMALPSM